MMKFNIKYSLSPKAGCACFSPAEGTHSEAGFACGNTTGTPYGRKRSGVTLRVRFAGSKPQYHNININFIFDKI